MEKITVNAEHLFTLYSKAEWVAKVPLILPPKIRSGEQWIWVDKNGDVFTSGRDFKAAELKHSFPCKVYRLNNVGQSDRRI